MTPDWTQLATVLRILGHANIAKAIMSEKPELCPHKTFSSASHKWLINNKLKPNTPLHAQLDLLNWAPISRKIKKEHQFSDIYFELQKLEKTHDF